MLGALAGAFAAATAYTAHYARATSYLSDDPRACINCHIMNEQYDGWSRASHHARATCNDCHVPHDSVFHKYYVKGEHGYRHSKLFTLQTFREPIRANRASHDVIVDNCVRCHDAMTHEIRGTGDDLDCIRCHASIAHGPVR